MQIHSRWRAYTQSMSLFDAESIDKRLGQRLSLFELFALALCVASVFVFARADSGYDLHNYLRAGQGDTSFHFYASWILPVYRLLGLVDPVVAFVAWNLAGIAGVFAATRVFNAGPKAALALLTYQMLYTIYYGNITGILLGGLAVYWWGLAHRRLALAGLGLTLLLTKFHLGIPLGLILGFLAGLSRREWLSLALVPGLAFLLSWAAYPAWPLQVAGTILSTPPNDLGSITLWQWLGASALLLWVPPLLLPLPKTQRLIMLVATTALALPYFQHTDLLALFVFPIGWVPLAGNIGFYLYAQYSWPGLKALAIIPAGIYLYIGAPAMWEWLRTRTGARNV